MADFRTRIQSLNLLIGFTLFWFSIINGLVFAEIAYAIGGTADHWAPSTNQYVVSSHGEEVVVSKQTFHFIRIHLAFVWFCCVLGLIGFVFAWANQDQLEQDMTGPTVRDNLFALLGAGIGALVGLAIVKLAPVLFQSQAMRTPWPAIPAGIAIGAISITLYRWILSSIKKVGRHKVHV